MSFPIHIVDDEHDIREAVSLLLESMQYQVYAHASGNDFLNHCQPTDLGLVLLDIRMPEVSGLRVQDIMIQQGYIQPIIFMSGHADIPVAVETVKKGALDFLEKPFKDLDLFACIERGFEKISSQARELGDRAALEHNLAKLTAREQEVMMAIAEGLPNKLIARKFDISPRTIEIHRARVFQKMEVENAQQLIRALMRFDKFTPSSQSHL
ncbi:MAG: response regulator transcription factor [Gammaproteobacteria bacterium]|nr:response regulator transcription factor [Gammaproteobacteria bacterium]